jgi:hypothetical protein
LSLDLFITKLHPRTRGMHPRGVHLSSS